MGQCAVCSRGGKGEEEDLAYGLPTYLPTYPPTRMDGLFVNHAMAKPYHSKSHDFKNTRFCFGFGLVWFGLYHVGPFRGLFPRVLLFFSLGSPVQLLTRLSHWVLFPPNSQLDCPTGFFSRDRDRDRDRSVPFFLGWGELPRGSVRGCVRW